MSASAVAAKVGTPYLLAFFFDPGLPLVVTAEVQLVEDGSRHLLEMPKNTALSNTENSVYTCNFTPTTTGWHVVQYRARSPEGALVMSNLSRFLVEAGETQTQVIRQVEGGKMVTSFSTMLMNNRGILSFKTRTK
jgi:hypothetical protein